MATSQDFVNWVCGPALLPEYLYAAICGSGVEFDRLKQGSTHKTIYMPALERFHVLLPPLPEQRRIADILDKADTVRRKRQEAIRLSEQFLRSTFLETIGPGHPDHDSWPLRRFEELADGEGAVRSGPFGSDLLHSEFVSEGVAVLGIDNAVQNRFQWGERRYITPEKYANLRRYTVKPGDVLVTIMGTTGRSAVVPDDIPTAITTKHLATFSVRRAMIEPEVLSHAIHLHPAVLRQIDAKNRGAVMPGLNLGLIKSLEIRLPPIEVQRSFVAQLSRLRKVAATAESAAEVAHGLFDTLVQRAFRGEL